MEAAAEAMAQLAELVAEADLGQAVLSILAEAEEIVVETAEREL